MKTPIVIQSGPTGPAFHRFVFQIMCAALLAVMFSSLSCTSDKSSDDKKQSQQKDEYTCPMHPSVINDKPSACPVCGMALVKKSAQQEVSAKDAAMLATVTLSPTQRVMANVATEEATRRAMSRMISADGVIDFAEPLQATVTARFRGRVEKLLVNFTGASVKKGQPLFEMYSPDLMSTQQEYLTALEAMARAQERGDASGAELQKNMVGSIRKRMQMHYGLSQKIVTELEQSKNVHASAVFNAPISGTVIRKQVQEGQFIDEGTTVYQLADVSRVWAYCEIHEQDLRFVNRGQQIAFSTDAYPGQVFRGSVTFIDPSMNPQTRTVRVRAELDNRDGRLKPQMFVKASLTIPAQTVLSIPATAVINTGKRNVVWVEKRENQFEPRDVRTGATRDGFVEILSGIDEGDKVVTSGGYLIDSESQLQNPGAAQNATAQKPAAPATEVLSDGSDRSVGSDGSDKQDLTKTKEVKITVDGEYKPSVIRARAGQKLKLLFYRNEDSKCTEEVVFKDFGIKKFLPAFKTTVIEITPKKPGTFKFSCGMDMVTGKVVVR